MSQHPLISVLTPSYNHEKYVSHFIESLVTQTYRNWELIIVDDCSTDRNIEEIKKFKDSRIHLYVQEFNQGPGVALNRAFSESHGEIIVDMASDDMLWPDYFEYLVTSFQENQKFGVIYSSLDVIDENNKSYRKFLLPRNKTRIDFLRDLFYKGNILHSPGMSIRREIYSKIIPMDASIVQHQDYQWHVLFLAQTECIVADRPYVRYRIPKRSSMRLSSMNLGEFNRRRLETESLMNSFLYIQDMKIIHQITASELCAVLSSACYEYIWAIEALKCDNYEKRQWGYKLLSKLYNNTSVREELNRKVNLTFTSYLEFSRGNKFFKDREFEKRNIRAAISRIYHLVNG